jgi:hypothetical protein
VTIPDNHITMTEGLMIPGVLMGSEDPNGDTIRASFEEALERVARGSYEPDSRKNEGSSEEEHMEQAYQAARDKTARLLFVRQHVAQVNLDPDRPVTVSTPNGADTYTVFEWLVLDPVHIRKARAEAAKAKRRDPYGDKRPREKSPLELEFDFLDQALNRLKAEERAIEARNREKDGRDEKPVANFHRPTYEKRFRHLRALLTLGGPLDAALNVFNATTPIPANPGVKS